MNSAELFAGTGEMQSIMRAYDWASSPLGPVESWPESLKTAVRIVLTSRYAMWMAWGPELTFFYNDTYGRVTLAQKHPWALGRSAREVWSEIWADIGPRIDRVMETGEATWDEGLQLFVSRNGFKEESYHTFSYSPLSDEHGRVAGMLCVVTEETERVLGERQLASLRMLAAELNSAITQSDVAGAVQRTLAANVADLPFTLLYVAEERMEGYRLAAHTGVMPETPTAPVHLAAGEPSPWQIAEVLRTRLPLRVELGEQASNLPPGPAQEPLTHAVILPIARQGTDRLAGLLICGLNPLRIWNSDYSGYLDLIAGQLAAGLANAEAYEQARSRAEALAEIDRAKTTFFSNVSHELRTPLTLMLSPLEEQIERPSLAADVRESLQLVHRNGLRLLKLVNTLLEFSRVEAGRVQAFFQPVDLSAYTSDLASIFRSAVERAGLKLIVDCPPLPQPVFVDPEMWEKVVLNLLSNALKSTFEGSITVCLKQMDGNAELSVTDTGTGIPESEVGHLFQRFRRVEGAQRRSHEGTGIGLALVQELIRMHGGSIGVATELGKGSSFRVSVPLGSAHLPQDRVSHAGAAQRSGSATAYVQEALSWLKQEVDDVLPEISGSAELADPSSAEHVLLVDDNPDMREYVAQLLRRRWRVSTAGDGREAMEKAVSERPDLILTDVMMPEMDGFELLACVRARPELATVPVIMLSARAGEEARMEGVSAGADDYVVKPFTARELMTRVQSHLDITRVRREAAARERELLEEAQRERNRLQDLFLQAPAAIAVLSGPEHTFTLVNQQYRKLTGRGSISDLLGKPLMEALPEMQGQAYKNLLDTVVHTGKPHVGVESPVDLNVQGRRETMYVNFVYQPWINRNGRVDGVFVHAVDVTPNVMARRAVEELANSVQQSESRLRAILQQVVSGIFQVDLDGRFIFVNERFCAIAGRSADELSGMEMSALVHPEDAGRAREMFTRLANTGETYELIHRFVLPDGRDLWVQNNWSAVLDSNGNPVSALCVTQDITERKRAQEALRRSEKLAAVGQMASTIAHEINNPLEAVTNLLYLIQGEAAEGNVSQYAKIATEELMRVSHVVTSTLQFHRRMDDPSDEQVSALVDSAVSLYQARLSNSGIETVRRMRGNTYLYCFGGELRQVFANMVGNAFDAMRLSPRRCLYVRVRNAVCPATRERGVRVTIADTGCGMNEETRRRIFEPFFTTKGNNGSGLGLWLSMDILRKHQCVLSVRTSQKEGRSGTVFSMFFPSAPGESAEEPATAAMKEAVAAD